MTRLSRLLVIVCALFAFQGLTLATSIGFNEEIGNSLTHVTDVVHTPNYNIAPGEIFRIDKFIHNNSIYGWTDFHIDLYRCDGPSPRANCVVSTEADGVSFDQPTPFNTWAANVVVDINNVVINPNRWRVARENVPFDRLDFFFLDFKVNPNDILSLHFDMRDFAASGNYWRLSQTATIPEPGTALLVLLGAAGILIGRRRN